MSDTKTWQHYRGKIAGLSRDRKPDDPELAAARLNLREARVAAYITRTVNAAPPLTSEQRNRLAQLLHAGATDA
jgi:hypothetical protein